MTKRKLLWGVNWYMAKGDKPQWPLPLTTSKDVGLRQGTGTTRRNRYFKPSSLCRNAAMSARATLA